ncbi:hypothetical protein CLOM621_06046 [Clostridium sp. M62/1]|nr:hypothetical protein CLOM621_06046 [Clostridium sp. M62/1]
MVIAKGWETEPAGGRRNVSAVKETWSFTQNRCEKTAAGGLYRR